MDTKKNIVYLLGAGASYNSVPIVGSMPYRIKTFLDILIEYAESKKIKLAIIDELKRYLLLIEKIKFFGTPDTLARKFYLGQEETELYELKNFLTTYFTFEQLKKDSFISEKFENRMNHDFAEAEANEKLTNYSETLDIRYLSFLATICERGNNRKIILPENVSIISWNYDTQMERAYQEYTGLNFSNSQKELNVFPPLNSVNTNTNSNTFSLLKLNGTASFFHTSTKHDLFNPLKDETDDEVMELLINIIVGKSKYSNLLYFAWEDDHPGVLEARKLAKEKIKNADAIAIIGYSFPDFNRIIDKEIFSEFKTNKTKVYLQDPNSSFIEQKLDGVKSTLKTWFSKVTTTQNFIIPSEFWEYNQNFGH